MGSIVVDRRSSVDAHGGKGNARGEGYSILAEADNGVNALEVIRKLLPDLVVLDLSIPKMDGLSVISNLKLIGISSKVLILTSGDSRNEMVLCEFVTFV
ncbi:response regulator [Pseudomonas sp. WS 5532]|uniref:response regulator n=1 Tax=Pseudomonas TaxID=286 RepID=UPI001473002C|nr:MULTISPECIES: response regulator [Pseudomonas]MCK3840335.1 response regulator [Pseudomonas sp. NCIMB 10586]MCK3846757.1 response regulator [Pseudomonas sp. W15Feb34]NMX72771.1 response regulator [Pseudomonas sp. WS 5532]QXI56488.1 response regulator [Pseudomonas sp. OE 28.3]VCU62959.1 Putative transcriptional regulator [Pseudomonas synxantha]